MASSLLEHDVLHIDDDKKIELAETYKESGKACFGKRDIEGAFRNFVNSVKMLILINPKTASENSKMRKKSLLPILQNNAASCHILKGNWEYAIDLCDCVLSVEPENVKALYRRGTAFMEIQEYEKSASDLYAAQAVEPTNAAVKLQLETLNSKLKKFNQASGIAMKKLFN